MFARLAKFQSTGALNPLDISDAFSREREAAKRTLYHPGFPACACKVCAVRRGVAGGYTGALGRNASQVRSRDKGIRQHRQEIDLVREYHTRLVADLVTGKLDVRDVALPEPALGDADVFDDLDEVSVGVDGTEDQVMYAGRAKQSQKCKSYYVNL